MRLNLLLILFMFLLIAVPMTSALTTDNVIWAKQGQPFQVKVRCDLFGYYCPSTTLANITINFPNSTFLINNQLMYVDGQFVIYNLTSSQTSLNGDYPTSVVAKDTSTGQADSTSFILRISESGYGLLSGEPSIIIISLVVLMILGVVFFYYGSKVTNLVIYIGVNALGFLMFLSCIMFVIMLIQSFIVNNTLIQSGYYSIFWMLGILIVAVLVSILVYVLIRIIRNLRQVARFGRND